MRIYHPYPDVTVIYIDDLHAKVDVYFGPERVIIKQPGYLGGRMEKPLQEYIDFEGNMRDWVLSLRDRRGG